MSPWPLTMAKTSQEFVAILRAINNAGLDQVVIERVELHRVSSDAKHTLTLMVSTAANSKMLT